MNNNYIYAMYWGVPFCLYVQAWFIYKIIIHSFYFQNILITVNVRYFENECPDIRKLNKTLLKRNCF